MSNLMEREKARLASQIWNGACPGCGGAEGVAGARGFRRCQACGSLWVPSRRAYEYDDAYPAQRDHDAAAVAACKVRTLDHWCQTLGVALAGKTALEVGFGGGLTLAWLQDQGAEVSGVEPVEANRAAAIRAGIPAENVKDSLAGFARGVFDLIFYLDSFEHVVEPAAHLTALNRLTAPGARAVLVLPVADSLSRRLMGRFWPHDIEDHWVFYSTGGLTRLWARHGWRPAGAFHPAKYVSVQTIARHWEITTRLPLPVKPPRDAAFWLNFGERGLVFEKT